MSVSSFDELIQHRGHHIVIVTYGQPPYGAVNVAIECETCFEVLLDFDRFEEAGRA